MAPSVEIVEPKLFAAAVADELVSCLAEDTVDHEVAHVALSGGSTPGAIYRLLAVPPRVDSIEWKKVYLYWGDERWVPKDDVQSNYRMVKETLLTNVPAVNPVVIPVDTSLPSAAEGATAYDEAIQKAAGVGPDDVPRMDILLLGMGEDGHTASLFPRSPLLSPAADDVSNVGAARHPSDGSWRVSFTPRIIRAAKRLVFIVKGESKAEMVRRVLDTDTPVSELPSRIWTEATGSVTFFLDSAAASKLKR